MITKHRLINTLSAAVLFACIARISAGAQTYQLTDLGVLPGKKANASTPAAINDKGQIAGSSAGSAFLYDKSKKVAMEDLGKNLDGSISRGFGINGAGQVVGDSTFGAIAGTVGGTDSISRAAIFSDGSIADLGTLKNGGQYSRANAINSSGQVVGFSGPKHDANSSRAFIWSASTGMLDLGTLGGRYAQAFGINDSGFVTGTAATAQGMIGATHAFLYHPSVIGQPMRDLGTLGGNSSYGMAINSKNHVVGYSTVDASGSRVHAFFSDGVKMADLGSLFGHPSEDSVALGVNSLDYVVGYSSMQNAGSGAGPIAAPHHVAFVYSNGVMLDLNKMIGAESENYVLYAATAINDKGQIVASAMQVGTNETHAVLLTPNATPLAGNTVSNGTASYYEKQQVLSVFATNIITDTDAQISMVWVYHSDGKMIGTLTKAGNNTYVGKFGLLDNPETIMVKTSFGDIAELSVKAISDDDGGLAGRVQPRVNEGMLTKR